jgi:hypothetical protein
MVPAPGGMAGPDDATIPAIVANCGDQACCRQNLTVAFTRK